MPELMDNDSFEQWQLDGEKTAEQRGLEAAQRVLEAHGAPELDPGSRRVARSRGEREEVLPEGVN